MCCWWTRWERFECDFPSRTRQPVFVDLHESPGKQQAPALPVTLMSGFGDLIKATGALPPHISAILSKPITQATLREALAKAFPPPTAPV